MKGGGIPTAESNELLEEVEESMRSAGTTTNADLGTEASAVVPGSTTAAGAQKGSTWDAAAGLGAKLDAAAAGHIQDIGGGRGQLPAGLQAEFLDRVVPFVGIG